MHKIIFNSARHNSCFANRYLFFVNKEMMKGGNKVKKSLLVILSSFAIFSLISCNETPQTKTISSKQVDTSIVNVDSSIDDKTSSETPSSIIGSGSEQASSSEQKDTYLHKFCYNPVQFEKNQIWKI